MDRSGMTDTKTEPLNIWETTNLAVLTRVGSTVFSRVVPAHLLLLGGLAKLNRECLTK